MTDNLTFAHLKALSRQMLFGVNVHLSEYLTEPYDDWSRVRSPSRARRRMRRGFRQNNRTIQVPMRSALQMNGALYMHPETFKAVRAEIEVRR